jgi:hypothetical protein
MNHQPMKMFSTNQIICLDFQNSSLYCEVIDLAQSQNLGWLRPVILVDSSDDKDQLTRQGEVYDLRYSSDLLWNVEKFRHVFDTEYIEFISQLEEYDWTEDKAFFARQKLREFLLEICLYYSSSSSS